jgi:PAS domain S-box-containing protein
VQLVVVPESGARIVYVTFFPAVMLAAVYGGRGPGVLAAVLSTIIIDVYWVEPIGRFDARDLADKVGVTFFLGSSVAVALTIAAMQKAQARAVAAEGELALAAERQRAGDALRRSEEKFSTMFEKAPLPAVLVRLPDGSIADVNGACLALFGFAVREVMGKTGVLLGLARDEQALARFLGEVEARGSQHGTETAAMSKAGLPLTLSNDLTLIEVDGKKHVLATMIDITARKQAEEALRVAHSELATHTAQLERLVEQRTAKLNELVGDLEAFSYSIVHDMRAPLRAMQGFAQVLAEECGPLSPVADDCVRRISTAAGRMDRLIQDGFNYGRLMREDLPLTPTDPEALLRGMIETYPSFHPPNAYVRMEAPLPLVQANEAGLTQCLSNLLGNAVKFVASGVIPQVRVWAESEGGRVRLLVQDNGIGMSKDAHRTLFRVFQRLGTDYEGTGVGLAIVKKAAERMGGRVGFESELGRGSTFWVELAASGADRVA